MKQHVLIQASSKAAASFTVPGRNLLPAREFSQLAENQIAAWLQQGGAKNLQNTGKRLREDKDRRVADALGVGNDYVQFQNFGRQQFQARICGAAHRDGPTMGRSATRNSRNDYERHKLSFASVNKYATSAHATQQFGQAIAELDQKAKKVSEAIISDSLRFNGRAPVPHARRFRLDVRIEETLSKQTHLRFRGKKIPVPLSS